MYIIEYIYYTSLYIYIYITCYMTLQWKDKLFDFALLDDKNSYDIIVHATKATFPQLTTANIINIKDNDGQTTLMINCIHCESTELVNFMLSNGADLQLTTNNGKGIFDFIKLNQHGINKQLLDVIGTKYLQTDEVMVPLNL